MLRRYWFEFDRFASKAALVTPRCGVTAYTADDAKSLLQDRVFPKGLPPITKLIEDVDVSTLDPDHVLNSMGPPNWRGVWYPLGYGSSD
jgi:hypothetical protein